MEFTLIHKFDHRDPSKLTKRKISIAAYALIAMCIFFAIGNPLVHAKQPQFPGNLMATYAAGMCTGAFTQFFSDSTNTKLYDFCVGGGGADYKELPKAVSVFNGAYDLFKAVGFLLAMSVALGRLFQKMERGQDGIQIIMMSLMSICITGIIIMNLDKIIGVIGAFGKSIIKLFIFSEENPEDRKAFVEALLEVYTGSKEGGALWNLQGWIALALPGIANVVALYSIQILIISKFLEIALLRMFAPLAVYDVYDEGLRSSGAMYLKGILACFISLAMSAFVASLVGFMTGLFLDTGGAAEAVGNAVPILSVGAKALRGLLGSDDPIKTASNITPFIPTIANFTCVKMIKNTDEYAKRVLGIR